MVASCQKPVVDSAKLLDVRAVAGLLGCSVRHVYRLSDVGRMPRPIKLGGLCRWSRSAICDWIATGCPNAIEAKGARR